MMPRHILQTKHANLGLGLSGFRMYAKAYITIDHEPSQLKIVSKLLAEVVYWYKPLADLTKLIQPCTSQKRFPQSISPVKSRFDNRYKKKCCLWTHEIAYGWIDWWCLNRQDVKLVNGKIDQAQLIPTLDSSWTMDTPNAATWIHQTGLLNCFCLMHPLDCVDFVILTWPYIDEPSVQTVSAFPVLTKGVGL